MFRWLASKLLPKCFCSTNAPAASRQVVTTAAPPNEPLSVIPESSIAEAEEPGTPLLASKAAQGSALEDSHIISPPSTQESVARPREDESPLVTKCSPVGQDQPYVNSCPPSVSGRKTPLVPPTPQTSVGKTPLASLEGPPDMESFRVKRFLIEDGKTIGYANTFRKNAENRPLAMHHGTPFEHLIDKDLALEMKVARAAITVGGQSDSAATPLHGPASESERLAVSSPITVLRQMR